MKEPAILTANTYFFKPAHSAQARRKSEQKIIAEVTNYLEVNNFKIVEKTDAKVAAYKEKVEVVFYYNETANNVYKAFQVYKEGKRSNITTVRKLLKADTSLSGWKWRPSTTQRRAFAIRMQDPVEKAEYEARKIAKADKRRAGSKFDYESAGGYYVPTEEQYKDAFYMMLHDKELTQEQQQACNMVMSGFTMQDKVHHDNIHIVNELRRSGRGRFGLGSPKKAAKPKGKTNRKQKSVLTKILDRAEKIVFG